MTTTTFYPNTDEANMVLDTPTSRNGNPATSIRGGTDSYIQSNYNAGNILTERDFSNIDTSALTSSASISSAEFGVYGFGSSGSSTTYNITGGNFSDSLTVNDFSSFYDTKFSTDIAIASWNTSGYNVFTLNSDGKGAISKTGLTKIIVRNANYDIANVSPSGYAYVAFYNVTKSGTSNDPYLSVTYTTVTANTSNFFMLMS